MPKGDDIRSSPPPLTIDRRVVYVQRVANDVKRIETDKKLLDEWIELWSEVKHELDAILRKDLQLIDTFAKRFPQVELTVDPRIFVQFAPVRDRLTINVLGVFFWPPYQLAGTLIHEEDHKCFFEEHNMLLEPEEKQKEFDKQYGIEMEFRAFRKELDFAKRIAPLIRPVWCFDLYPTSRTDFGHWEIAYKIQNYIKSRERAVKQFSERKGFALGYHQKRQDESRKSITNIMEKIGVSIDVASLGKTYERISAPF